MNRPIFKARPWWIALVLVTLLEASPVRAHFLWVAVDEGPNVPRVTFGETPDEATPEKLVARLADARARDDAGATVALTPAPGAWIGSGPRRAVAAQQSWGLVDRSGDGSGAFLLEYYAKGVRSAADLALDLKLPLELFARTEEGQIVATLRRAGQSVAGSTLHVTLPSGRSLDRETNEQGEARFEGEGPGLYGLRGRWLEARAGEADGKKYGEVRHYTTLTFALRNGAPVAGAVAKPLQADPAAYALLKQAHDSRQVMPPDFAGFRSELIFQQGDQVQRGELVYRRQGETEVRLPSADAESLAWARRQILNLVGHRRGGDFAEGDGRYPLQFGPDDGSPYGRLVLVHDATESSYRIRDQRVTEVTRTMDGSRFTISVIESMDADDGKYLANHFLVAYRDPAGGALQKLEGYRDSYDRIGGVWLPKSRMVIEVADTPSPIVRTLRFRRIEALGAAPASNAANTVTPTKTP